MDLDDGVSRAEPNRSAVVDLGSNSVRLVVFEGRGRNPVPVFNEKLYVLKSPRIEGAKALFVDPIYTPINYAYVWVNDGK